MASPDNEILRLLANPNPFSNLGFFSEVGIFLQEREERKANAAAELQADLDALIGFEQEQIIESLGHDPADAVVLFDALATDQRALSELQQGS